MSGRLELEERRAARRPSVKWKQEVRVRGREVSASSNGVTKSKRFEDGRGASLFAARNRTNAWPKLASSTCSGASSGCSCLELRVLQPLLLLSLLAATVCSGGASQRQQVGSQQAAMVAGEPQTMTIGQPVQSVLLDTTEQSSLGWTKYPDGGPQTRTPGWVEESFTNFERGINWRSFVVCDVAFNSVNNWLWTPYIERGEANRLYIEIKFTMRDCNLFPQMVLSCKETFALLYKEMEAPIQQQQQLDQQQQQQSAGAGLANASFAQSDSYTLVDAIAADEGRFTSNTDVVINTEIRSIPVSKRGVYFAFRDQGACLSLISIKIYHLHCPQMHSNFALFNSTPTGRDLTSLVAVEGSCVPNSLQIEQPKMFCGADGNWNSMSSGQCKCLAGFEPAANQTKCQPCQAGKFKPSLGDQSCHLCPERSSAPFLGASECKCHENYFRAQKDPRSAPCTQPPSAPSNLSAVYVDSATIILQWQPPRFTGNRDDLTYKLVCDNCDLTMVSSPQFYSNFSETKCILSGLSPSTSYRFLVYSMNGVSQLSGQAAQFSEISLQTLKQVPQTTANTLSGQGGFQLTPIYNFRAFAGARGTDMILAWDAQQLQPTGDSMMPPDLPLLEPQQLPSLYEIRYQPRHLLAGADSADRRSPYPASLVPGLLEPASQQVQLQQQQQQSVTTTNRAIAITTLAPKTEYAFQIRTKWAHSSQWSEFSEPIFMTTTSQAASHGQLLDSAYLDQQAQLDSARQVQFNVPSSIQQQQQQQQSSSSWWGSLVFVIFCALLLFALASLALLHYRKSMCLQNLSAGFGTLSGSSYGGVYGSGASSNLMGIGGFSGPLGAALGQGQSHHQHQLHRATLSAGSAGGLITGSNATSRSSSGGGGGGAGNVVQNFIAATLGQIGAGGANSAQTKGGPMSVSGPTSYSMGGDAKLFASNPSSVLQHQRNHYHQTLGSVNHTMLLGNQANHFHQLPRQQQQQQGHLATANQCNQPASGDLFKYRTLSQQAGAHFMHQDPQQHIYDDLDNTTTSCSSLQGQGSNEIEPQLVSIESVIGRGEFGDVCLALLRSPNTGAQTRVAVKTLKAHASDKAKLDFLIEASIMSQFEHPNIVRLEGVVTRSEPPMIVSEYMENGSLDSYLRDNKDRFTCLQLISMLRGIASGMQYLAKLNYVHKDLAARNILVNGQNVCKIADFGLSAHQSAASGATDQNEPSKGDYSNDSTSTNSSNTLSSQTTGSTPTTASTLAGSSTLNQLQSAAKQIAQQRFAIQQQQQQQHQPPPNQPMHSIQNPRIPVRWTALEAIAFRRFTSASDVWSYGIVCWEVMTQGERPYWNWTNQDVIKAIEQGYRLPQPEGCPEQLYKLMLDCWLKDRAARPTFGQILNSLDRLLSPYDDPFSLHRNPFGHCQALASQAPVLPPPLNNAAQLVPMHTRISNQEPAYYDTYNPIGQLMSNSSSNNNNNSSASNQNAPNKLQSVDEWLDSIKMSRYKENFQRHQINTLQYVARLGRTDLELIGIQNGQHLKKMVQAIMSLRSASSIGASGEGYLV